jgi:hypothetical protein
MRIVIEVDGEKVTAIGTEAASAAFESPVPTVGDPPPGPAPETLLARARKLGAMSAGAARFGIGAALASTSQHAEPPRLASSRRPRAAKKRAPRAR